MSAGRKLEERIKFLNPARDGAVLPILHLNGYKISGPTVQARTSDEELAAFYNGRGYTPYFVEGDDPELVHQAFADALDRCYAGIREIQKCGTRQQSAIERNSVFAALADDYSAHAERMDVPERSGWRADRRHVSRASGSALHRLRESRASENAGSLDARIRARKIIR